MIKVGKILGIRRFLGDFFDFFAFVDFFVGDFGSSSEHSDFEDGDFLGLFLIGSVGFSGLRHLFSDAALL